MGRERRERERERGGGREGGRERERREREKGGEREREREGGQMLSLFFFLSAGSTVAVFFTIFGKDV